MANRRGKGESSNRFSLLGSKITADDECRHEIRRKLILGWKAMTNLVCVCVCVCVREREGLSAMSNCLQLHRLAHQAPLCMEFSR